MSITKKVKNIWSVPCQKAHVDSRSQLISMIDILEKLDVTIDIDSAPKDLLRDKKSNTLRNPVNFPVNFTLVSYWEIDPEYRGKIIKMHVEIESPKKKPLGYAELKFKSEKDKDFHKTFVEFHSLPLIESGIYSFNIQLKEKDTYTTIRRIPFIVDITTNPKKPIQKTKDYQTS